MHHLLVYLMLEFVIILLNSSLYICRPSCATCAARYHHLGLRIEHLCGHVGAAVTPIPGPDTQAEEAGQDVEEAGDCRRACDSATDRPDTFQFPDLLVDRSMVYFFFPVPLILFALHPCPSWW